VKSFSATRRARPGSLFLAVGTYSDPQLLLLAIVSAPAMAVGLYAGHRITLRMSREQFLRILACLVDWDRNGACRARHAVTTIGAAAIRDRDCVYGTVLTARLRAMGIRDK
jgi:hypothetical protein